jgi:hypothetical protein
MRQTTRVIKRTEVVFSLDLSDIKTLILRHIQESTGINVGDIEWDEYSQGGVRGCIVRAYKEEELSGQ